MILNFLSTQGHTKFTLKNIYIFKSIFFDARKYTDFANIARGFHVIETRILPSPNNMLDGGDK
jgi:hypothetical protein